jgi:hypothetical protein
MAASLNHEASYSKEIVGVVMAVMGSSAGCLVLNHAYLQATWSGADHLIYLTSLVHNFLVKVVNASLQANIGVVLPNSPSSSLAG